MLKIIKTSRLLSVLILILIFNSCVKEVHLYLQEGTKLWAVNDSLVNKSYVMIDNNGISYNFSGLSKSIETGAGTSGFLFIPTKQTFDERIFQQSVCYENNHSFSMSFYPSVTGSGSDQIHFYLNDLSFHYQINNNQLDEVSLDTRHRRSDQGVSSKIEVLPVLTLQGKTYKEVMRFTLNDFENEITPKTVIEVYYAKGIGLIKYTQKNKISFERLR